MKKDMQILSKKLFIETISAIKNQYDHDKKCFNAFKILMPGDYIITGHDNHWSFNQLVKIVEVMMGDSENGWIKYYIWELDFGKKWKSGMIAVAGIDDFRLETVYDLWDLLQLQIVTENDYENPV